MGSIKTGCLSKTVRSRQPLFSRLGAALWTLVWQREGNDAQRLSGGDHTASMTGVTDLPAAMLCRFCWCRVRLTGNLR